MSIKKNLAVAATLLLMAAQTPTLLAQTSTPPPAADAGVDNSQVSEGEVRKIDPDTGKITIRHGPIKNLAMPPMTMLFQVKNPAMLDLVKPGDRVKFIVERVGGAMVLTHLQLSN